MLGFGPITAVTPAGSPLLTGVNLLFNCGGGEFVLSGGEVTLRRTGIMQMDGGEYNISGSGSVIARHRNFQMDGGHVVITGGQERFYKSTFFYGDPEVIRVPAEIRSMSKAAEPRDMVSLRGVVDSVTTDDEDDALSPRLRRT